MNSRRFRVMAYFFSIVLFLNSEIRGREDEVNNGAHAIAHLGVGRGRVWEIGRVGDEVDDLGLGGGTELAAAKKGVERVHQPGDSSVGSVGGGHPGTQIY